MKQILMALAVVAFLHNSAEAQAKKSKYDVNYKVCKSDNGYATCGREGHVRYMTNNTMPADQTTEIILVPVAVADDNNLDMNVVNSYEGYYRRHNIVVGEDEMNAPYQGLPSQQYDGPDRNAQRNLNYNQTSIELPPSDGSNMK